MDYPSNCIYWIDVFLLHLHLQHLLHLLLVQVPFWELGGGEIGSKCFWRHLRVSQIDNIMILHSCLLLDSWLGRTIEVVSGDDDPKVVKIHHARQLWFNPAGLQNKCNKNYMYITLLTTRIDKGDPVALAVVEILEIIVRKVFRL